MRRCGLGCVEGQSVMVRDEGGMMKGVDVMRGDDKEARRGEEVEGSGEATEGEGKKG